MMFTAADTKTNDDKKGCGSPGREQGEAPRLGRAVGRKRPPEPESRDGTCEASVGRAGNKCCLLSFPNC